ncbi:DUF481 domain-containing protein [Pistricoccus aurantiacus]|uniref:DUF481 domain-containing protein n=1 Tax=Pistricoccus aurantiacus TaxID=1883414 RepID=A0A5B8SPM7_9GAMM|nr:DUF481 domain-containing protein [Pistricoccus aurantiacus]QEA37967.1 DUF481 domain-containing protein [Pistricoccus aurantiacus]
MVWAAPFYSPPPPQDDAPSFSGDGELGYTNLSGNTNSETLIAKIRLTWLTGLWTHRLRGEAKSVVKDSDTSAEQYLLSARGRRDLEGPHYLFGFARWEKDRFSGYDQQFTMIAGYGRTLLDEETRWLALETGAGYRLDDLEDEAKRRLSVAYGAVDGGWYFSETASLSQELSLEVTRRELTTRSLTALTAHLNSHLALRLSHEIKHNSSPPDEAEAHTDLTTSASLLYQW